MFESYNNRKILENNNITQIKISQIDLEKNNIDLEKNKIDLEKNNFDLEKNKIDLKNNIFDNCIKYKNNFDYCYDLIKK